MVKSSKLWVAKSISSHVPSPKREILTKSVDHFSADYNKYSQVSQPPSKPHESEVNTANEFDDYILTRK